MSVADEVKAILVTSTEAPVVAPKVVNTNELVPAIVYAAAVGVPATGPPDTDVAAALSVAAPSVLGFAIFVANPLVVVMPKVFSPFATVSMAALSVALIVIVIVVALVTVPVEFVRV